MHFLIQVPFADLNSVKSKFENLNDSSSGNANEPKPVRCITPPRDPSSYKFEIENEPMQRPANVVAAFDRVEDVKIETGLIRSRKEIFSSFATDAAGDNQVPNVRSITPPREENTRRVLKESTPERNENVSRETDKKTDFVVSSGHAKQRAAIFTNGTASTRQKSIERSGITIEGELAEKGIAKSRLALFNDPNAVAQQQSSSVSVAEQELEAFKTSAIAKERLNLFKNLEQQQNQSTMRTSPSREIKKLKEFTPPPQFDHTHRQYIIIVNMVSKS